jgi:SAM-dependent methyltransferase
VSIYHNFLRRTFYFISYFGKPPWDSGISPPELLDFLQNHPPGRALDLGCGTGTNAITLAKNGWNVIAIDFMPKAIRQARKKTIEANLRIDFQVGDVTRLDHLTGGFDFILDIGCFHNLSTQAKKTYANNLARLLAPGGNFLLYGFLSTDSEAGIGISTSNIAALSSFLTLIRRDDSTDRGRPSTWLQFTNPGADDKNV